MDLTDSQVDSMQHALGVHKYRYAVGKFRYSVPYRNWFHASSENEDFWKSLVVGGLAYASRVEGTFCLADDGKTRALEGITFKRRWGYKRASPQEERDFAVRLALHVGIPVDEANAVRDFRWDGKTLKIGGLSASQILHDIAHYLIADKKSRTLPEYGLGTSVHVNAKKIAPYLPDPNEVESRASALGIEMENFLGMDWKTTYSDHQWSFAFNRRTPSLGWDYLETLESLLTHGHLLPSGRPTCLKGFQPRTIKK